MSVTGRDHTDYLKNSHAGYMRKFDEVLARTDDDAMDPQCFDPSYEGGWAWWADIILTATLQAEPEDRARVSARHLQAVFLVLR